MPPLGDVLADAHPHGAIGSAYCLTLGQCARDFGFVAPAVDCVFQEISAK
jgi:hypothetical protein